MEAEEGKRRVEEKREKMLLLIVALLANESLNTRGERRRVRQSEREEMRSDGMRGKRKCWSVKE